MHEIFGGMLVLVFMILLSGIKIVREHDRLVIFRFGKIIGDRGPGMQLVVPLIDRSLSVDTRITASTTALIETTTLDNVPVKLSALCRFYIKDAAKAIAKVDDPIAHTVETMHTVLRSTVGEYTAHRISTSELDLNNVLKRELGRRANGWGVRVKSVEIRELSVYQSAASAAHKNAHEKEEEEEEEKIDLPTLITMCS
ncbi:MAG: hypothetical protein DKT66_24715 [Candidatus Melainabacteria bacterium]|nr:MAG: hypothetical protein DKT66_24715 [Candidatus Melainabacteria bacterium]